jgi:Fic family protein
LFGASLTCFLTFQSERVRIENRPHFEFNLSRFSNYNFAAVKVHIKLYTFVKRKAVIYASQFEAHYVNIRFMMSGKQTYIWQSPEWPKLSVNMQSLSPTLSKARVAQGKLVGLLASLNLADASNLQIEGWVSEAQSSAKIEGETLQLNSVRASVARRLGLSPSPHRQDTATEGMLDILQSALTHVQEAQRVTHATLHLWHECLFPAGRSGITKIAVGRYRDHIEPMQIVTPKLNGNDIVHFQAPPSTEVVPQMSQLLAWFDQSKTASWPTDGLVRAALAYLWFEAIHPYEDGNGRLGRALAELALFQDWKQTFKGAVAQRLFSLSQQMWLDRKGYYAQVVNR